jgi:transcriptional regulator with XRE-family HTH domain
MEAFNLTTQSSLGDRLLQTRLKLRMSQTQFAELCGVSKSSQSLYEKNTNKPDADYFQRLHSRGIDLNWLISGDHNDKNYDLLLKEYKEISRIVHAWARKEKLPLSAEKGADLIFLSLKLCHSFGKVDQEGIETLLRASLNA